MRVDNIFLMKNEIKEYDWGGTSFIPSLLGQKEDGLPKAEMWLGAHKTFSSKISVEGRYRSLYDFLKHHRELLGNENELSFLFKVLSAQRPLSIQIHPSKEIALTGFKLENDKGVNINDPRRIYKDENPKIELVYALSDFYALKGFLPLFEIKNIYKKLKLDFNFTTHKEFISNIFDLQRGEIEDVIARAQENLDFIDKFRAYWFNEIYKIYGVDIGLLVFLGMHIFKLNPGEVLYTESQEVHAYLRGECLELMTNSDNVIRAGLTTKYVDKNEMLKVGRFEEGMFSLLRGENIGGFNVFKLPGTNLSLLQRDINGNLYFKRDGTMVLLVINGEIKINDHFYLKKGESAFIGVCNEELLISGGGTIFIAYSG
ncbi:mannose-6-phosphate isomerase, class I [Candidatus Borreliella tachyglossi]|uniref:mannose-6-phosphate isomerase n=1 Tax=Candidatus Borreliella tachyglossi TaxID=1964448 RepID=A0A2S1LWV9_9SPIR|nr:mannose-6-phosphate isomerase, class I [Candidatus Borreliella tachyglossi]AWG42783.1 mannose-6-phosphate isomerase, class I [Candidatus Borreliella tachyglossi]